MTNMETAYHWKIIDHKSQPIGAKAQIINPYPKEFVSVHTRDNYLMIMICLRRLSVRNDAVTSSYRHRVICIDDA